MMRARANGVYEPRKHALLKALLKPGMTFIDIGACVGDFTLFGAKLIGIDGRVLAYEPHPENCDWLQASVIENGFSNVLVRQKAVADYDGTGQLFVGKKSGWHSLRKYHWAKGKGVAKEKIEVPVAKLDTLTDRADVVKVDTESGELEVLKGATELLKSDTVWLIDLHRDGRIPRIGKMLRNLGFHLYNETGQGWQGKALSIVASRKELGADIFPGK